jgi:alkylation response protein AidB-like acyl-CoA dehydrogenase
LHDHARCQGREDSGTAGYREGFRAWLAENDATLARWRGVRHQSIEAKLDHSAKLVNLLWSSGWGRAGWPEAVGGTGGGLVFRQVMMDELCRAGIDVPGQYASIEVMAPMLLDVRPDLAVEFLPPCLDGRELWVQGFSEPEAGSDIASLRTRAVRDGDDFVLNGQKVWGSFGACASRSFVLTRTGTPESRHRGLTMFFVDLDAPGVTVRPLALASGMNHTAEMFFDDARVPASRVIGEVDGGWASLMQLLQYERGSYAWERQAVLQLHLRETLAGVDDATRADPRAAAQVGAAYLRVLATRAQAARTVSRLTAGQTVGPETSIDKVLLGPAEHAVADVLRDLRPHEFLLADTPELPELRDDWWYSRATTVFGGAAEVQRGIVADRVLGLPKEGA